MQRAPIPDRRVERTKAALHGALISLMPEKGYDATTVQDVLDRANVGRATFYAHFDGKDALLDSLLDNLAVGLRAHRDERRAAGDTELLACCTAMFEHAQGQRALYRGLVGRRGGATVMQGIRKRMALLVREELEDHRRGKGDGVPLELVVEHVVASFSAVLAWWLDHRTKYGPSEIDEIFRRLTLPGLESELGER